jgi:hypothetical protein
MPCKNTWGLLQEVDKAISELQNLGSDPMMSLGGRNPRLPLSLLSTSISNASSSLFVGTEPKERELLNFEKVSVTH